MAYVDESLGNVLIHHLSDGNVNLACKDTFAQWDICEAHEGKLFNREVPVSMRDQRCQNCCTSNQPAIKLTVPIRHSSDLGQIRRAWQSTFASQETEQVTMDGEGRNEDGSTAARRSDKFHQVKFNSVEPARWTQYWLAAWFARCSVIPAMQKGIQLTGSKLVCLAFMRDFVDDWQLRHPEVARFENNTDESHGPRPHMQCPVHKRQGSMFPIAGTEAYDPACFVCLLPPSAASHSAATLPREISSLEFNELCGTFTNGISASRAASSAAASSREEHVTSMYDVEGTGDEEKEMS